MTHSEQVLQWSTGRQWRGIKRTEGERRRKEIGGDKCCWDSRCSRKSCVFVTFLKERVAPALTDLHQQSGDVGPLRLVKDQRRHGILQHSPYTSDPLEGHCGSRCIFFPITILHMLSRYNSLIEGCCVFQLWAFATILWASLIESLSSCATRQAPLREIRLLSRLLQIRVMWGHGCSEDPCTHTVSQQKKSRPVFVREQLAPVWMLSTLCGLLLSRTFASFWFVQAVPLICWVHKLNFSSSPLFAADPLANTHSRHST